MGMRETSRLNLCMTPFQTLWRAWEGFPLGIADWGGPPTWTLCPPPSPSCASYPTWTTTTAAPPQAVMSPQPACRQVISAIICDTHRSANKLYSSLRWNSAVCLRSAEKKYSSSIYSFLILWTLWLAYFSLNFQSDFPLRSFLSNLSPTETMLPCEFCEELFPEDFLILHQVRIKPPSVPALKRMWNFKLDH